MIEEELEQTFASIENKKLAKQLQEIKTKVKECSNKAKNYHVPALDLRE
jgi:hypothetical protein